MIIAGIILTALGFFLRLHVYNVLNFKHCWKLRKLNKLRTDGIFKYIRHPLYLGTILYVVGLTLISTQNIGLALTNFVIIVFVILGTIDHEETMMTMYFGEEYINYVNKTKMLIPFIW